MFAAFVCHFLVTSLVLLSSLKAWHFRVSFAAQSRAADGEKAVLLHDFK